MLRSIRVLTGLVVACFVAAAVLVVHVSPWLLSTSSSQLLARVPELAELTALYATQLALFALPFGVIAAVVAEANRWRGITLHVLTGLLIAAAGFALQVQSEGELRTLLNPFAIQVFSLQGLLGGLAYWLVTGRYSGWRRGGGPFRTDPLPVDRPRLKIADAEEGTRPANPAEKAESRKPGQVSDEATGGTGPVEAKPDTNGKPEDAAGKRGPTSSKVGFARVEVKPVRS